MFRFSIGVIAAVGLAVITNTASAGSLSFGPGPGPGPGTPPSPPPVKVNEAPVLTSFEVRAVLDDYYVAEGTLTDESPEQCVVFFSGALAGYSTYVRADGSFSLSVELGPGEGGAVDAQAVDDAGNYSNVLSTVVFTE
ncbi:MAG: hypothetical protein WBC44_19265 [Planctomycetaceae bacterium]